jgi:hypothetical protein
MASFATDKNISPMCEFVLELVSKKLSNEYVCNISSPSSKLTFLFISISDFVPTSIFITLSGTFVSISLNQFGIFSKLCLSVTSYTNITALAPL